MLAALYHFRVISSEKHRVIGNHDPFYGCCSRHLGSCVTITAMLPAFIGDEILNGPALSRVEPLAMCEKCADLDAMIVHYRQLAGDTLDLLTKLTIEMLLDDLIREKADMHRDVAQD